MKERTKTKRFKIIIYAAAIAGIGALLVWLINFSLQGRLFGDAEHHTNVPEAQEEIDRIIEGADHSVISFMNVNYYQGVYTVTFYCEKLDINDAAECNKALAETVDAFERIVSGIDDTSELFDKRICVLTKINGQLPYNYELCNYENDHKLNNTLLKEPDFKKLVSVHIDFPADDISFIYRHKDEIVKLSMGASCNAESLADAVSEPAK